MRKKRCKCCRELYPPDPRTYLQQKTCDKESCRAWRLRQKWRNYIEKDPQYASSRKIKQKQWRESHPGYWRAWREAHREYVARNLKLQKARDAKKRGFLAKPTEWRLISRQNLESIRKISKATTSCKATEIGQVHSLQIDGILKYLQGQLFLQNSPILPRG